MKIERTFIISLPERLTDRLIPMIDSVKDVGLDYSVFTAIKKQDGKVGLLLTIEKLFLQCLKDEMQCILVLEDDAKFIVDNPLELINKCLSQLPEDFDCLHLGCNLCQEHVYKYSPNLIQLSDAYSTHAVIYSRSAMFKILKAMYEAGIDSSEVVPLDVLIRDKVMPDGKVFCAFPIIATQTNSYSDISHQHINAKKIIEERFLERTKHL